MKIKKQFLNDESLKTYGFEKSFITIRGVKENGSTNECVLSLDQYVYNNTYCDTVIDKNTGVISVDCFDSADISDVVYHLIVDGLVEI